MFDGSLTGPPALAQASNRELIDAIAGWSSAAAAAEARKFAKAQKMLRLLREDEVNQQLEAVRRN